MPTSLRRPGQNIRQLARRRRAEAIRAFIPAIALSLFLVISTLYFAVPPFYVYVMGAFSIGTFIAVGRSYWQGANRAAQGAKAEEDIGRDLASLTQQGWQIEYGKTFRFIGDVDIICQSPRGQVFVIDVKSHRGTVVSEGSSLRRRYGKQTYSFEKDFLQQVKQQAVHVKEADGYRYVRG